MKKLVSILITVNLLGILFSQTIQAAETYENIGEYKIDDKIKEKIVKAIERDPANKDYIDSVIDLFKEDMHTNSNDLNELLLEALESIYELDIITKEDLKKAEEEQKNIYENEIKTRGDGSDAYYSCLSTYNAGIQIVKLNKCPQTAKYMEHAIVPYDKINSTWKPSTYYHNNDSWANNLVTSEEFFDKVFCQFEEDILVLNKSFGTVKGTFAFTTKNSWKDAYVALHKVNYSVTFTKQSSGGYSAAFKITDTYDFEWSNYDSIAVGLGNNYCVMMQNNRWIRPFSIVINSVQK